MFFLSVSHVVPLQFLQFLPSFFPGQLRHNIKGSRPYNNKPRGRFPPILASVSVHNLAQGPSALTVHTTQKRLCLSR